MSLTVMPFYAALLTIFYFILTFRVVRLRRSHGIGIGDGGNKELKRAIRVHGNFGEYIPLALVLLLALELQNFGHLWLHILGSLIFLGRVLHFLGLGQKPGYSIGRFWGSAMTYLSMKVSAVLLLIGFFKNL